MKVFISWSAKRSSELARALAEWLPHVLQNVVPFLSAADIDSGERWAGRIAAELEGTSFGVLCLTPENREAPWIHFEAGALAKMVQESRVCPYLLDTRPIDIGYPLAQFQMQQADEDGTKKLVRSINNALGKDGLDEARLAKVFAKWWPELKASIDKIEKITVTSKPPVGPQRSAEELLGEILFHLRNQTRVPEPPPEDDGMSEEAKAQRKESRLVRLMDTRAQLARDYAHSKNPDLKDQILRKLREIDIRIGAYDPKLYRKVSETTQQLSSDEEHWKPIRA